MWVPTQKAIFAPEVYRWYRRTPYAESFRTICSNLLNSTISTVNAHVVFEPVAWIHETESFYNLPSWLDHQFAAVVQPTDDGTRATTKEVKEYKIHKESIAKIIASIRRLASQ